MTENFWQQEKERIRKNQGNINPIIKQTFEDKQALVPNKNFRELYYNCMKGDLNLKSWEKSDSLSLEDMGMLICRDVGCELQYCQASMADPYEKPFENCDEHFKKFYQCQEQEKRRYIYDNQGRTLQEQIAFMLEKKKNERMKNMVDELEREKNKQIRIEQINKERETKHKMTMDQKL